MPRFSVYGFTLETDHPITAFLDSSRKRPDLFFTCDTVPRRWEVGAELIYESVLRGSGGEGIFSLYRDGRDYLLHYPGSATFIISDNHIHCHLLDLSYEYWVEIVLLGPVLSFWLELRGMIALHASAVVVNGEAIAFTAGSQAGKTGLAAHMVRSGADLLSDDVLPVRPMKNGRILANSGYPQMRMWPDQAAIFARRSEAFPLAHPEFDKRRIPASQLGSFHDGPVPLRALFQPERWSVTERVSITRVAGAQSLVSLARASFAASLLERMPEFQMRRLGALARVLGSVPLYRLRYPEGYDRLETVKAAILEELSLESSILTCSESSSP